MVGSLGTFDSTSSQLESPFLDNYTPEPAGAPPAFSQGESPFLNEYILDGEDEAPLDAKSALYAELMNELEDEEMEEALHGLVDEASDLYLRYAAESPTPAQEERVERILQEHFAPLANASEAMIDAAAMRAETIDLNTATESEVNETFEGLEPDRPLGSPAFEQFFGALKKKLKKVVSKASGLVKKGIALASGPLLKMALAKLKPLVRPLLTKVLKIAMDKIPAQYRPLALQAAQKLGIKLPQAVTAALGAPAPDATADAADAGASQEPAPSPEPAAPDPAEVQQELDLRLTEALLVNDLTELEAIETESFAPGRDPLGELDRARAQFVREIVEAKTSAEAGPIVERFLPAVMMALRTGIKLIGRPKVVSFLGNLIGKFIAPFVGREAAPALGKVVADLGLKTFLQAELDEASQRAVGVEALAGVVEETVRRVGAMPLEMLEQPGLGEALMYEAFQSAAAASFPAERVQHELRESESGGWVTLPLRGRRHYKKFGRVFDVNLSPQAAGSIVTYGGGSLGDFLRDRLRLAQNGPIAARVHLFEAIPHTRLPRIAAAENVRGLGSSEAGAWSQLHPLTQEAAAILTGAPKLGRPFDEEADRRRPMIGERYYFLEIPSAPVRPVGRESHLHLTVDFPKGEIRVCMYLGEVVAQKIATALRKQASAAEVTALLRSIFGGSSPANSAQGPRRKVRLILPQAPAALRRTVGGAIARAATKTLRRQIRAQVLDWSWARLSELFAKNAAEFIAKTDGPEDGVRLAITFQAPIGFEALKRVFLGKAPSAADWPPAHAPSARIEIKPGPKHD